MSFQEESAPTVDETEREATSPFPTWDDSGISDALGGVQLADESSIGPAPADKDGLPSGVESFPAFDNGSKKDAATEVTAEEQTERPTSSLSQATLAPVETAQTPTIVVTGSTDTEGSQADDDESDEDRRHRTHFKSWGTPTARNKPSKNVSSSQID